MQSVMVKRLMSSCFNTDGLGHIGAALGEMISLGGSLNAKLLGAAVMPSHCLIAF